MTEPCGRTGYSFVDLDLYRDEEQARELSHQQQSSAERWKAD
jgi:hypothetical protein